ncbi:formimidoylglutamase [Arsukibacterium sp.]|uniref:formimidoylglutamase n=1 Tax=Arsukibacterium sp. TaxID=1977258 RepID=UPI002FD9A0EB
MPATDADLTQILQQHAMAGGRYVLLGIPEDIGPRANGGMSGAAEAWPAFLQRFVNLQHNGLLPVQQILLLGSINCDDLLPENEASATTPTLQQLRTACAELDKRVEPVVTAIFVAGLIPIVIGGGHNNALPMLSALCQFSGSPVNCLNLDPHADCRPLEGRHSGNGFSYAFEQQLLEKYMVLGLHEQKNSSATLGCLTRHKADYLSYQAIFVRQILSWQQAIEQALDSICQEQHLIGLEVDVDCINSAPASALTYQGISLSAAEQCVYQTARIPACRYLHLAEAAPAQHPAGLTAGYQQVGQLLTALVLAFIEGKQQQAQAI